jgi:hypothetical protein
MYRVTLSLTRRNYAGYDYPAKFKPHKIYNFMFENIGVIFGLLALFVGPIFLGAFLKALIAERGSARKAKLRRAKRKR